MADELTKSKCILIFDSQHSRFELEPYRNHYFIHQTVYKWSKSCFRETLQMIEALDKLGLDLRVFVEPTNEKLQRYAELYNFRAEYLTVSPDNQRYIIMRRP